MKHHIATTLSGVLKKSTTVAICFCIVTGNILTPGFVRAVETDVNFYSGNDILFHDPNASAACKTGVVSTSSSTPVTPTPPISASGTLDEKIAKMFVVGFSDSDTAGMDSAVSKYKIGGLFFHGNSITGLNKTFFDGLNKKAGTPLLISSDDEGGKVTRFIPDAPSAETMSGWDEAKIEAQGKKVGETLKAIGVTSALAPVLDLNGGNTIWTRMQRDWSANPDTVAQKAGAWARGLKSAGINPVYKHFPGLGNIDVNTDLTKAAPVSLASLKNDLKPFKALASQNGGALMLGNMFIKDWNGGSVPVSISSDAVDYVRNTLKFNGLIMTDDLMAKYIAGGNIPRAVAKAVEAGVDMPLFTGGDTIIRQSIDAVKKLPDVEAKVNTALQRIAAYKTNLVVTAPSADVCCAEGGGGSTLSGNDNLAKIFNFLTGKGLTPEQAAGSVGNMILESGLNPQRLQGSKLDTLTPADQIANTPGGWGIVQWTPAGKMINPTTDKGKDPNDLSVQLDFLWNQLITNEKPALDAIKATSTVEAATQAFGAKYERPGDLGATISLRTTYAKAVFENTKGTPLPPMVAKEIYGGSSKSPTTPTSPTPASTTPSSCGGATASVGGYKNPFRDLKNSGPMRVDGGVDWGGDGKGSGPVYAIGNAKITSVRTSGSGWPGLGTKESGGFVAYRFSDGAAQGKAIYIAEDCTPKVKVGDTVTADTVVCDYKDQGTHLEIGWSDGVGGYVDWCDYTKAENNFASNAGQDISKFLVKLGLAPGIVQGRLSTKSPPADWPKW